MPDLPHCGATPCHWECLSIISPRECHGRSGPSHRPPPENSRLRPSTSQHAAYTYLIGMEGSPLVKIGRTSVSPKARLAGLQTGQPATLLLLWHCEGAYEKELHQRFSAHRIRGEWFDLASLGDPVTVVHAAVKEIEGVRHKSSPKDHPPLDRPEAEAVYMDGESGDTFSLTFPAENEVH